MALSLMRLFVFCARKIAIVRFYATLLKMFSVSAWENALRVWVRTLPNFANDIATVVATVSSGASIILTVSYCPIIQYDSLTIVLDAVG